MHYHGKVQSKSWQLRQGAQRRVHSRKTDSKNFHDDLHTSLSHSLKEDDTSRSQARQYSLEDHWRLRIVRDH